MARIHRDTKKKNQFEGVWQKSDTHTNRRMDSRDAPKFGLGRTSAEYSAEGFGSVRFGHASTFGRTSVLFGLGFAPRFAHFIACVQSLYFKN